MHFLTVIVFVFTAVAGGSALLQKTEDYSIELGMTAEYPAESCKEIYNKNPVGRNQSGYYWIKSCKKPMKVYCEMQLICGCVQGGWMKIADVQDGENCPSAWKDFTIPDADIKVCRIGQDTAGIYSANYSTEGACLGFQHFCGKVIGYQSGSPDGFNRGNNIFKQIDDIYFDGISITYGYPRKHLFSLAVGVTTTSSIAQTGNCPCSKYPGRAAPAFVRDHYYCDSGNQGNPISGIKYFPNDTLWDGEGCSSEYSCCSQPGMPYFYRSFPILVNEDIEVRLMADEAYSNEAILVGTMELYVL